MEHGGWERYIEIKKKSRKIRESEKITEEWRLEGEW